MYRCLTCQKPFTSFETIVISSDYGDCFDYVTPCCNSYSYSDISGYCLTTTSGSAGTFRQLEKSEAIEMALNWAIDFAKENK